MSFHYLPAVCITALALTSLGCSARNTPNPAERAASDVQTAKPVPAATPAVPPLLNYTMDDIDGKPLHLADFSGKVLLLVNVASKCGYTPQYKELQALYQTYSGRGLVIIGIPANDFKDQEPGTNSEIRQFCTENYGVTFPMLSKVHVIGDQITPLYVALTRPAICPADPGPVKWNFEKFLISRDGRLVARFRSPVKPQSPEIISAIESQLSLPSN